MTKEEFIVFMQRVEISLYGKLVFLPENIALSAEQRESSLAPLVFSITTKPKQIWNSNPIFGSADTFANLFSGKPTMFCSIKERGKI